MRTSLYIFLVIITISKSYSKTANHCGYYSTKKVHVEQTSAHLKNAVQSSLKNGEKHYTILLYTDELFSADSCRLAGIEILSFSPMRVFVRCPLSALPYLYSLPGVLHVARPQRVSPQMDTSRILCHINDIHSASPQLYPNGPYTGKNVLVGLIDTEFDTHHPAFLDSSRNTRFVAIWDQVDSSGEKFNKYRFGTIKNHQQLLTDTAFGSRTKSHGTFTAGAAAGSDYSSTYYGVAPDAMIIGVCYDNENHLSIINGIEWIFSVADSLNLPCVINLSLGITTGPHDGTSEVDKTIDQETGPGRIVVGAAGNDGNTRSHVLFSLSRNQQSGTWITPTVTGKNGDSTTWSSIDIWGVRQQYFSVTTQMYNIVTSQFVEDTIAFSTSNINFYKQDTIIWNNDTFHFEYGSKRSSQLNRKPHAYVFVKGTNPDVRIGVRIKSLTSTTSIHAWNGFKKSFESLDLEGYVTGDHHFSVDEIGGTAKSSIVVGSYLIRNEIKLWNDSMVTEPEYDPIAGLARFSGRGPTVDGRIRPDITAPGAKVHSSLSAYAQDDGFIVSWPDPPRPYGRYSSMTGTSISAPIVTGTVALLLQAKPQLTPDEIKDALQKSALKDLMTGPLPSPDNNWGAGKLNGIGALRYVLGIADVKKQNITKKLPAIKVNNNILTINGFNTTKDRILIVNLTGAVVRNYQFTNSETFALSLHSGIYTLIYSSGTSDITAQRIIIVK